MTDQSETLTIRMPAQAWATMDAEMDGTGSTARVEGPQEWADLADAIREEGWRQVPWVDGEWPPMEQEISLTLIDRDVEMIQVAGNFGAKVYYGDGTRLDLLRQAGAHDAQLLLFCIDGDQLDRSMLEAVHEAFPDATIYVRAYDRRSVMKMHGAPIEGVVREVMESAISMARRALTSVGVDETEIARAEAQYRKRDLERLHLQKEAGDIYAGGDILRQLYAGTEDDVDNPAG